MEKSQAGALWNDALEVQVKQQWQNLHGPTYEQKKLLWKQDLIPLGFVAFVFLGKPGLDTMVLGVGGTTDGNDRQQPQSKLSRQAAREAKAASYGHRHNNDDDIASGINNPILHLAQIKETRAEFDDQKFMVTYMRENNLHTHPDYQKQFQALERAMIDRVLGKVLNVTVVSDATLATTHTPSGAASTTSDISGFTPIPVIKVVAVPPPAIQADIDSDHANDGDNYNHDDDQFSNDQFDQFKNDEFDHHHYYDNNEDFYDSIEPPAKIELEVSHDASMYDDPIKGSYSNYIGITVYNFFTNPLGALEGYHHGKVVNTRMKFAQIGDVKKTRFFGIQYEDGKYEEVKLAELKNIADHKLPVPKGSIGDPKKVPIVVTQSSTNSESLEMLPPRKKMPIQALHIQGFLEDSIKDAIIKPSSLALVTSSSSCQQKVPSKRQKKNNYDPNAMPSTLASYASDPKCKSAPKSESGILTL